MRGDLRDEPQSTEAAMSMSDRDGTAEMAGTATLRTSTLLLSLIAIPVGALVVACGFALMAILILVAHDGRDGASDLLMQLQFDLPLRARLSAATISALYVGLFVTTLGAAYLARRRHWRPMLALVPWHPAGWEMVAIPLVTLVYAAAATFSMTSLAHHKVIVDGPTDYVLVGTIVANLVLLAPVAEELLFRGWLYTALRARLGFIWSFTITAALFAAMHWDANHRHMLLVLPLAVALGVLREVTGSIKPTILLHAVYNLIIIAITLAQT